MPKEFDGIFMTAVKISLNFTLPTYIIYDGVIYYMKTYSRRSRPRVIYIAAVSTPATYLLYLKRVMKKIQL